MASQPPRSTPIRLTLTEPDQLRALSNLARQRILGILTTRTATLSGLAADLGLPRASVSYHLKVLRAAGLVRVVDTTVVKGGARQEWSAAAREFDITEFAGQPGVPANLLRRAVEELAAADHRGMEVTRTRRVRVRRDDFTRFAERLNALFDELDRIRVDGAAGTDAADPPAADAAVDVHDVTLAVAFFRNHPRREPAR